MRKDPLHSFFFYSPPQEKENQKVFEKTVLLFWSTHRFYLNHSTALAGGNVRSNPENPAESK